MKYDIVGDIHGCYDEFIQLLKKLNYEWRNGLPFHRDGRQLIFLGDITDRGPESLKMIDLVAKLVDNDLALYIPGNHCNKLYRYFLGRPVQIKHGLETTVSELNRLNKQKLSQIASRFKQLYESSPLYLVLEEGKLIVAHAGIKEDDIGLYNERVKTFVLYGDITGQKDSNGKPIRKDWAVHYQGASWIIYGHTPVHTPRYLNKTINIDTGCVFGGALTACRFPECVTVSVPSNQPLVEEKFTVFETSD